MIEFRQKDFGKKEVASSVLSGIEKIRLRLNKSSKDSAAKQIAKSVDKSHVKRKVAKLKELEKTNPKLAQRKLDKLKRLKKRRLEHNQKIARKKLENLAPANPKTKEQIDAAAEKLVSPKLPTAKDVKEKTIKAGKSVLEGAKTAYTDTGRVITHGASKFVENPAFEVAMRSGDAYNYAMITSGNPELAAIPVGGILAYPLVKAQKHILGRKGNRKLRQTGIKIRKSKLSNWSLKKALQKSKPATSPA